MHINTAVCSGFDNCYLIRTRGKKLISVHISSDTYAFQTDNKVKLRYSQLCIKFKLKGYFCFHKLILH